MAGVTAREAAARALMSVFTQGGYSNLVLDHLLENEDLSPRDRSFCTALFYTTVQRCLTLDALIDQYSSTPVKSLSPAALACLRCGFCQLLFMPGVPESAAVSESVAAVRALGEERAAGLVNGVLRAFLRAGRRQTPPKDKLTALSVQYSVPMPLIQLWRKSYGHQKAMEILEGLEAAPPIFVRANTQKTTSAALVQLLAEEGVSAVEVPAVPGALRLERSPGGVQSLLTFAAGLFHVQDLSSQRMLAAAATLAGRSAPKTILDVCAAPGGKSFTLAQLFPAATVTACDLYPARVGLVETGAARLELKNLQTKVRDAVVLDSTAGLFDLVLCDVVCSGFGILRRKPEIRYKPLETLDGLPEIQYNILDTSAAYCAPGGRLVYSTCTLNPAENEAVTTRFLEHHPRFAPVGEPVTLFPGELGGDGFFYLILEDGGKDD